MYNWSPVKLARWRLALQKVRDGVADARLLFIGDSTTSGFGSTLRASFVNRGSYPARVTQLLNTSVTPAMNGLAINYAGSSVDGRWVLGTGWAGAGFGMASGSAFTGVAPSGNLVFTTDPAVSCDRWDVYWLQTASGGTITCNTTGASPSTINTAGASAVGKTTISVTGSTSISLTGTADAKSIYVIGVEPHNSATFKILVGTAGVDGKKASDFVGGSPWGTAPFQTSHNADLTCISLGINDTQTPSTAAQYIANIASIVSQCPKDVVLISMPPSGTGSGVTYPQYEALYQPALLSYALQNNIPLIDWYGRLSNTFQTSFMFDALHPNNSGYWDIAQLLVNALTTI